MTDTIDNLRDYQAARWRQLAEKRLEHITDLFVSGRWTRYFGESDFLEIVRQSKAAVESWRKLDGATRPDPRLPLPAFAVPPQAVASDAEPVSAPALTDSAETELAAVASAMAEVDEIEEPAAAAGQAREPESGGMLAFCEASRASLLPSPFAEAIGGFAVQRLRLPG